MPKKTVRTLEQKFLAHFSSPLATTPNHSTFYNETACKTFWTKERLDEVCRDMHDMTLKQLYAHIRLSEAAKAIVFAKSGREALLRWYGFRDMRQLDIELQRHRGMNIKTYELRYGKELKLIK